MWSCGMIYVSATIGTETDSNQLLHKSMMSKYKSVYQSSSSKLRNKKSRTSWSSGKGSTPISGKKSLISCTAACYTKNHGKRPLGLRGWLRATFLPCLRWILYGNYPSLLPSRNWDSDSVHDSSLEGIHCA